MLARTALASASLASVAATPVFVELASGEPKRALAALSDLWFDPALPIDDPRSGWHDYLTGPAGSAAGAVSYFLALYGYYIETDELLAQPAVATLDQIGARLHEVYGVRSTTITAVPAPVLPVLVQLADDSFAVAHDFYQAGNPTVFVPSLGPPRHVPSDIYEQSLKSPAGLLPILE